MHNKTRVLALVLVGDPSLQDKLAEMQRDGVVLEACVACATKLGVVEQLRALDIDVKGMGRPLTDALKDPDTQVLTF